MFCTQPLPSFTLCVWHVTHLVLVLGLEADLGFAALALLFSLTSCRFLPIQCVPSSTKDAKMAPSWVKDLKPAGPQGTELLKQERAQSNVPVEKLSEFLFTKEVLSRQDKILKILKAEQVFDKSQNYFAGREPRFITALARQKRLQQLNKQHGWTKDEYITASELISEPGPYGLHVSMFLITLRDQGTPEQHELFLKKAEAYEIIGCYAQTELGHGSNVRGLETTATWNPEDKTFVLHSPHLTASKWWIGSLGRTANHAVVMAQLVIAGRHYGPHPFVVQIRDMKTHEPLENVHVGDIGPKFGCKSC